MKYRPLLIRYKKEWILIFLVLFTFVLGTIPSLVEWLYSTGIYPYIGQLERRLYGWIPISMGDLLYGLVMLFILLKLVQISLKWKRKQWPKLAWRTMLRKLIRLAMMVYLVFQWLWGLNYHRQGTAYQLNLHPKNYPLEDLTRLTDTLTSKLFTLVGQIEPADSAVWGNFDAVVSACVQSYDNAAIDFPFARYKTVSVKKMIVGDIGGYGGFSGYLNPFTGEAQANAKMPPFLLPFVVCHEMAHQLGYAAEEEANMLGYLSGKSSNNPAIRYSVYHDLLMYAGRKLFEADTLKYKLMMNKLPKLVKEHNNQAKNYYARFRSPAQVVFNDWYDMYLKANSQKKGYKSYSYVTAWLIAYANKFGWEKL